MKNADILSRLIDRQVTSFLDSVKASGTNAINMVKDNSQIQAGAAALKSKANQITDNVTSKFVDSTYGQYRP